MLRRYSGATGGGGGWGQTGVEVLGGSDVHRTSPAEQQLRRILNAQPHPKAVIIRNFIFCTLLSLPCFSWKRKVTLAAEAWVWYQVAP